MVLFTNNIKPMSNAEYRKHAEDAYNEKVRLAEAEIQKGELEYHNYMLEKNQAFHDLLEERADRVKGFKKRENWFKSVKDAFVIEAVWKIYEKACTPDILADKELRRMARNTVAKFVFEHGGANLLRDWKTKNLILSELARICNNTYDKVVEGAQTCGPDNYAAALDKTIEDDFFSQLNDVDTADASKLIQGRVSDAIEDFLTTNASAKMDYEEIFKGAEDIKSGLESQDAMEEATLNAKRKVDHMRLTREKNVFHCMVEALAKNCIKDEKLSSKYIKEGSLDMDGIVNGAQILYTMLEVANTTYMIDVDETSLENYIKSLN
jgi:hypothetical protein